MSQDPYLIYCSKRDAPLAACGGRNFWQIEGSDFITRPLLSDYENILCCHPLSDEVCVGVDEADNAVVVFGVLIADAS